MYSIFSNNTEFITQNAGQKSKKKVGGGGGKRDIWTSMRIHIRYLATKKGVSPRALEAGGLRGRLERCGARICQGLMRKDFFQFIIMLQ